MKPSIGRIVHYFPSEPERQENNLSSPIAGVIVAVWSDNCVNLKLICDAFADQWRTSVLKREAADDLQRWDWPERA